ALPDAQFAPERGGEAERARAVLGPRAVVLAVVEAHAVGVALDGRDQLAVIDELLHVAERTPSVVALAVERAASASATKRRTSSPAGTSSWMAPVPCPAG